MSDQAPMPGLGRRCDPTPPAGFERVGWVRDDGDEYHDFRYATPGAPTDALARDGFIPVFVRAQEATDD